MRTLKPTQALPDSHNRAKVALPQESVQTTPANTAPPNTPVAGMASSYDFNRAKVALLPMGCIAIFPFGQLPIKLKAKVEAVMNLVSLRQLSVEKRMHLVEELWDSIAADQGALPLTIEQRLELDRRLDSYEADGSPGRLAKVALDDIRKSL